MECQGLALLKKKTQEIADDQLLVWFMQERVTIKEKPSALNQNTSEQMKHSIIEF